MKIYFLSSSFLFAGMMKTSIENFRVFGLGFSFIKSFLYLCFLQLFPVISALDITSQLYFKAYVSENRFPGPEIQAHYYPFSNQQGSPHIRFLSLCTSLKWCDAACFLSSGTAVVTNLYVIGYMTDTMAGNKALCFTKRPKLLYPNRGVSITASPTSYVPARVIENVADGVYGFQMDECYYTQESVQYILIELSESRNITQIIVRSQPKGLTYDKFIETIVRVGDIAPIGTDFTTLTYFGKHDTGPPPFNADVIFENAAGVQGKYISIDENHDAIHAILVCTIEIIGF